MHAICEEGHEGQVKDVSNKLRGQFLALYFYQKWLGLYAMDTLPSPTIFSMETLGIFGSAFDGGFMPRRKLFIENNGFLKNSSAVSMS